MFAIATKNFVEEVDKGGLLIPASSLNDVIAVLTVVVKRKRFWFWQKPKYLPTDFNLNDILTGDTPIKPVVVETDFIKYSGTFGDNIRGTLNVSFGNSSVNLEGKDSSKLQSSFGSLKKEEVDVQKLLHDSKDRVLDMSHCLIEQTKEKHKRVFGIVKERILTTQPCSVIEEVQQSGQCGGGLSSCGPKGRKFSLKENGSLSKDSNITMEIPTHATIAYGLIELEVKQDGRFELCLMLDTHGGFEVDGHAKKGVVHTSESDFLQQELARLKDHFQLLSSLPASTKSSLLQHITDLMEHPAAVSALQNVLDQMYVDKKPGLDNAGLTDFHRQNIQAVLVLLEQSGQMEPAQTDRSKSILTAFLLIVSALDEMTQDSIAVLRKCSSPTALQALERLVQCVSGNGAQSSAALTEGIDEKTKDLFASCNVSLKKHGDLVQTETKNESRNRLLVLCVAVRSLASLAHCG
ncbi:gasdermin Eb isoform 1-T2 [Odontesthes bonariensis]|uniref:gasdermin Eb n=1 Tax=Odontesthes bonariensis TaxID=219752 RepID=UPI003F586D50